MIVTHTENAEGHRRVYLGGKASLECWIEPLADGTAWNFHIETAPGRYPLPQYQQRDWATYVLLELARELAVPPAELAGVAFERIAALHTSSPLEYRRVAAPRRQRADNGYVATAPNILRPKAGFTESEFVFSRRRA